MISRELFLSFFLVWRTPNLITGEVGHWHPISLAGPNELFQAVADQKKQFKKQGVAISRHTSDISPPVTTNTFFIL